MIGVEIKPELTPDHGWAEEAARLIALARDEPLLTGVLIIVILMIILILPGGVVAGWLRYRGADRKLEHRRIEDVAKFVQHVEQRDRKRPRPRKKGGRR